MAETLWDGGPILHQAPGVFPMGTDSILLAHFARPGAKDRILDFGTGSGILPVLLLSMQPRASAAAIELEPAACQLAQKNFSCNDLDARVQLISGDLRQHRTLVAAGSFDLTVSNPPYFPAGTGYDAAAGLQNARGDGTCTLDDLCRAAAWATRWGGRFCLVFRPDRIAQLFTALERAGFAPKRLRPVHHDAASAANLVLVEARRGGKPGLIWEKDLYLYTAQGQESPELREIYHRV